MVKNIKKRPVVLRFAVIALTAVAVIFSLMGCSKKPADSPIAGDKSVNFSSTDTTPRPVQELVTETPPNENKPALEILPSDAPAPLEKIWRIGDTAPNGGIVYYAQNGEFYEVLPPAGVVSDSDPLPKGWLTPDMEDLTLIREGVQKQKIADYGAWYYVSVTKSGGKPQYLRMSDGQKGTEVQGLKVGVRKFDPTQPPAEPLTAFALTQDAIPGTVLPLRQLGDDPPPIAAAPSAGKYAIGDTGPNGGIIFYASNGKYKEITKPGQEDTMPAQQKRADDWVARVESLNKPFREAYNKADAEYQQNQTPENLAKRDGALAALNADKNVPVEPFPLAAKGWRMATAPDLISVYDALKKTGKVDFGNVIYMTSSQISWRKTERNYTRNAVSYTPGGADGERLSAFPGYRIILAGGGPSDSHFMDMANGAIFLINEDNFMDGVMSRPTGYKNFTNRDIRIPYVKEF
jgi:hypothetical protein